MSTHTEYMASVNISIKEEAYRFLESMKDAEKSFSDVILSFKRKPRGVMRFFGVLQSADWKGREKRMASLRKDFEDRL